MTYIMVDIEADGVIPGDYSMIDIGAVPIINGKIYGGFRSTLKPISDKWNPEALAISGFSREETLNFNDPLFVMTEFEDFVLQYDRPMFISDNNGFDWMFVCWYFHHFLGRNPFGHSSTNLGSLYKGLTRNLRNNFKRLRKTKHTHNPFDDAMGNAEALIYMNNKYNLNI